MSDPTPPLSPTAEFDRPIEVFVVHPTRQRYWIHVLLLLATIFTTLVVGARMEFNFLHHLPALYTGDDSLKIFPLVWALHASNLALGIPFSFALMTILLAHEMGHYVYCVRYGVRATLPFFIPFPTLFGTMGAFIRIRAPIRSRAALFDIGIAGPIAGFIVASAMLLFSLGLSQPIPPGPAPSAVDLGLPAVFYALHWLLTLAAPAHTAVALPLAHVYLHPVAVAAWVGMFATALNLLPGGQLDGGHIVFSLAPRAHRLVSRLTILILVPLAYFAWSGWLLWSILLALSGMRHPVVPERPPVAGSRWRLAIVALAMLALTWTPKPIRDSSVPEIVRQFRSGQ